MTLTANFKINSKIVDKKLQLSLFEAMLGMLRTAKRLVPVDTARLRNSIELTPTILGAKQYTLFTPVNYAASVEFGTLPHEITPVNKKALSFNVKGNKVVTKKVNHPGTVAQPFFRPALFRMQRRGINFIMNKNFKK